MILLQNCPILMYILSNKQSILLACGQSQHLLFTLFSDEKFNLYQVFNVAYKILSTIQNQETMMYKHFM